MRTGKEGPNRGKGTNSLFDCHIGRRRKGSKAHLIKGGEGRRGDSSPMKTFVNF